MCTSGSSLCFTRAYNDDISTFRLYICPGSAREKVTASVN